MQEDDAYRKRACFWGDVVSSTKLLPNRGHHSLGVDLSAVHVVFPATNQNTLRRFGGSQRNCWSCAVSLDDGQHYIHFLKKCQEDEHGVLCQDLEKGALYLLMHPTDAPFEGPHFQVD